MVDTDLEQVSEEALDSSAEVEAQETMADEADSPTADDSKQQEDEPKSLADVVESVIDKQKRDEENAKDNTGKDVSDEESEGESKEGESSTPKEESDTDKVEEESSDEFTEEELKALKPSTQKRIQSLSGKLKEAHSQLDESKPNADRYEKIVKFMDDNGISAEDSAEAFTIMALIRKDPEQALRKLQGTVEKLSLAVGDKLPSDLERKVEDGELSESDARELSRARAAAARERHMREQQERSSVDYRKQVEQNQARESMAQAVNQWQASIQKQDPDYSKKHEFVKAQLQALVGQYGMPENEEKAIQYANIAYGMVNKNLSSVVPQTPVNQAPSNERLAPKRVVRAKSASGTGATKKPESLAEVVDMALGS